MEEKTKQVKKGKKGLIVCTVVLLLIAVLFIASNFIKDGNGISYLNKFKSLFIIQDDPNLNKEEPKDEFKYDLKEYLTFEEKVGRSADFNYQYITFTNALSNDLYKDFNLAQSEFMSEESEKYYVRRELKTIAEIYNNVLSIFSIQTSYTQDMPVVDSVETLYINLENNTKLSNNDIIAMFDYNVEGILHKVLEDMVESSNADHYFLNDEETVVSKEEFKKNIPIYAQKLSGEKLTFAHMYVNEGKLFVAYIESSILTALDLTYDRFRINETVNSIELVIVNQDKDVLEY